MDITYRIDAFDTKRWYNEAGKLHRIQGPAVEYANGDKEWWLEGHQCKNSADHCKRFFASRGIVDSPKPERKPTPVIIVQPKLTRSILTLDD